MLAVISENWKTDDWDVGNLGWELTAVVISQVWLAYGFFYVFVPSGWRLSHLCPTLLEPEKNSVMTPVSYVLEHNSSVMTLASNVPEPTSSVLTPVPNVM